MRSLAVVLFALGMSACAARRALPPPAGMPDQGLAERVALPYDPAYPRVVVVVEPVALAGRERGRDDAPSRTGWGPWGWSLPTTPNDPVECTIPAEPEITLADALTVDLEQALDRIGNVERVSYERYLATPDARTLVPRGYAGPYVVGGAVQEFNEHVDSTALATGTVLGTIGTAMSIAGSVIGEPGLTWGGIGLAAVSPAFDYRVVRRTGSVALDLRIFDAREGLIVTTLAPHGSSTARSGLNGFALFGFGRPAPDYSLSLLGRAHRDAFNTVTTEVWERLKSML